MSDTARPPDAERLVPDDVIPHGTLPPLRYRDLPEPVAFRKMIGPGIILAGLSLGSGEFVFWPYITYKSQFVFFWACVVGVTTQYFLNMEIARWTLATGESAITGFCRLSKHWAWVFLLANVIPWMIPAWAKGAAVIVSWILWEPALVLAQAADGSETFIVEGQRYVTPMAIGGMFMCGLVLTAGPVIYNTVEKLQMVLVGLVMVLVVVIAVMVVRPDALAAQVGSTITLGYPQFMPEFTNEVNSVFLLGAIAFAGVGGTLNLGQSNYIKDKGYGMGLYIGRITSPITGQEEPISEVGYHFPHDEANLARWKKWWRLACWEHFWSFLVTCLVCLVLLTLISYSLFYQPDGTLRPEADQYGDKMNFVLGEAVELEHRVGPTAKLLFLVMGIAILLTTELGVLDAATRISTDVVKVNWLADSDRWTESRLYYAFLWGAILLGTVILLVGEDRVEGSAFGLFKLTAAINGAVMFIYAAALLVLNRRVLPAVVRIGPWRSLVLVWAVLFYGFFAAWVGWTTLFPASPPPPA